MDEDKAQKAREWFVSKISAVCPTCQQVAPFNLLNTMVAPVPIGDNNMALIGAGGPNIPMVGLVCTNCSHIRFFSAVMLGL